MAELDEHLSQEEVRGHVDADFMIFIMLTTMIMIFMLFLLFYHADEQLSQEEVLWSLIMNIMLMMSFWFYDVFCYDEGDDDVVY